MCSILSNRNVQLGDDDADEGVNKTEETQLNSNQTKQSRLTNKYAVNGINADHMDKIIEEFTRKEKKENKECEQLEIELETLRRNSLMMEEAIFR